MRRIPAFDRRRAGMTLVEVLAVCMIIAILASLTLPAVSRAIGRGRLTRCTNNQYQVAFALLRYDEQFGGIPGWLNVSPNNANLACAWTVPLLPFLGRSDVYDMWPTLPNNPTIDTLLCPANRPSKSISYPPSHYAANVGVSGTNMNDGVFVKLVTVVSGTVNEASNLSPSLQAIADSDGTSTTLAFSEKCASTFAPHTWDFDYTPALVPAAVPFGSGTSVPPVFGVSGSPVAAVINSGSAAVQDFAPSSPHNDGVVVAYCDGHTGFLSNKLQPYEYGQLLTPKSRWTGATNTTNSAAIQPWLLNSGSPYLLDEKSLRP